MEDISMKVLEAQILIHESITGCPRRRTSMSRKKEDAAGPAEGYRKREYV